jgi:peptidoglycan hydrolase-like protein with peptidoglycan-binding domain
MRLFAPIVVLALATGPAAGQKPAERAKAAPAKPATAATAKPPAGGKAAPKNQDAAGTTSKANLAIRESYAAIPLAERLAIQSDLIWSGDYNGGVTGDFNDRAIAAVKAFQKRNRSQETGILNPQERAALAATVKAQQDQAGWRVVDDKVIPGIRLGIPGKLVQQTEKAGANGSRWSSARGEVQIETFRVGPPNSDLAAEFERQKKGPPGRRAEYSVLRPDFFVVSGLQGLKKFYVRAQFKDNEIRGMTVLYDQAMDGIMEPVVIAMSSAFSPFDNAAGAGRRKVEYSTGFVVSASGHVIADRQATDGCHVVTVAGRGHAERVAEDTDADMALLRIYGLSNAKPIALASDPPKGAEITLVGITDPQMQNGGGSVSTASSRLAGISGSLVALDAVPAPGFSGAAAIDAQGQLVGMVEVRATVASALAPPQAALVPTATIRKFLEKANVVPVLGRTTIDDAKTAVARVICVRK